MMRSVIKSVVVAVVVVVVVVVVVHKQTDTMRWLLHALDKM